ncbi:MAG: bifunctional 3-phosphoshikimate 1-carboxyvinyltransferase/cytidylate kinase [Burkholderiales bacterium]|nr:bifunctional 3-phosphoshikimate 1-carboxyvinyltransferase/cytidylate kinase [Burkholderiales bacterium]
MKEQLDLPPMMGAKGEITLPGSKSISNRVLLLAALSIGKTEIRDLLDSDDTERMLDALKILGVNIEFTGKNSCIVEGISGNFPVKDAKLFLGNAGTAFRPLTAALAFSGGHYHLHGVPRMHERPIGDLVDALRLAGAEIAYLDNKGYPPLEIFPAKDAIADSISVKGNVSSQFLTGLLMALPLLGRKMEVKVEGELISKPYIGITLAMMERFGVKVEREGWERFFIAADSRYRSPGTIHVEGDASSASYFLAAGAIGRGPVRVYGVGKSSIQGDAKFARYLEKMGAKIEMGENWIEASAPENGLDAIDIDCNEIPDAAMTLAVAALFAKGKTTLRNIASWRVKETDRIAAMAKELSKFGAIVEEGDDFIAITPPPPPFSIHGSIDTYDDHRMAMCFSLAAFGTHLGINDPSCVAKTFPEYFEKFLEIAQPVPVISIDGPSASGKGTVAAIVAQRLNYNYLDSGALYRISALAAMKAGISLDEGTAIAELMSKAPVRFDGGRIFLEDAEITEEIRSEACSSGASKVAAFPEVRAALLERQKRFRKSPGLVADGRDMGSTVFPDSQLKIYLTASAEERAMRRYKQLIAKGEDVRIDVLLQDIRARDERDSKRSAAPLQKCDDATLIDTTEMGIEEAVSRVLELYRNASSGKTSRFDQPTPDLRDI